MGYSVGSMGGGGVFLPEREGYKQGRGGLSGLWECIDYGCRGSSLGGDIILPR
ncbi:hypothetical protein MCQ_00521 [Candidatus Bartonella washoeensis Sb944nv]|uniref:Uncharacterized protein n=1 Tax=Candidatus Bartonella washoeensis Sb944nv TaxID=1094563 RepID=J1J709_9HYPH|nr:hypothetical protein [Bartonella washoeensis]EJF80017.1 hypothetical protein MCQ_00521 [Bartonella washoeensis Sb944nv]